MHRQPAPDPPSFSLLLLEVIHHLFYHLEPAQEPRLVHPKLLTPPTLNLPPLILGVSDLMPEEEAGNKVEIIDRPCFEA
jgi:hypothetical protein